MTIVTKVFKSGNSAAVRLPKEMGLEPGVTLRIERDERGWHLEKAEPEPQYIDLAGIYGSIPGLKPLTRDEREFEERELDWEGKLLGDG